MVVKDIGRKRWSVEEQRGHGEPTSNPAVIRRETTPLDMNKGALCWGKVDCGWHSVGRSSAVKTDVVVRTAASVDLARKGERIPSESAFNLDWCKPPFPTAFPEIPRRGLMLLT